ncbi:MAG: hypothetical protein WC661_03290 [Opitutaceae bacterium]|jgi:hypothetical protein
MSVRPASIRQSLQKRSGFALLITITLLAFLVLLLVSLASLTRVETQVASNGQQLSQARQNALMALNVALGELQKYAGPDQRTTARSDMDAALANTSVKSGRWTGIYGRGVAAADTVARNLYTDIPSKIATDIAANSDAKGNQAVLLNWLVSGNEGTSFDPSTAVDANGQIDRTKAPAAFAFTPSSDVAGLSATSTALSTNITIANQPARLLVGSNSVGTDSASVANYVAAPLKDITAVAPGLGAAPVTVGRYAWWVGDEGAKARINLPLAGSNPTLSAAENLQQQSNAFVSSQRAAVELVDGANVEGAADTAPADAAANRLTSYDPSATTLPRLLSVGQLDMLGTSSTARRYRFHDLTAISASVLSDAYAGGLKKDLSALLATGVASPAPTDFLFTPEAEGISPITTRASTNTYGVPTWGMLRSFVTMRVPAMTRSMYPRLPSDIETGISPVLTNASVGFQYMADDNAEGTPIRLALFPLAVLWNPYTFTLKGAKYEFGVTRRYMGHLQLQARVPDGPPVAPSTDPTPRWRVKETRDFLRGGGLVTGGAAPIGVDPMVPGSGYVDTRDLPANNVVGPTDPANGVYLRFVIDASDVDLEPGQSVVFTLPSGSHTYSAPDNGSPTNELKRGLSIITYAVMPSACSIGPGELNYRITSNGAGNLASSPPRTMFSPGNRLQNFTHGEVDAYLGAVGVTGPDGYGLEPGSKGVQKPWYQSISRSVSGGAGAILKDGITFPSVPTTGMEPLIAVRGRFSASPTRWIAQNNLRAPLQTRLPLDEGTVPGIAGATVGGSWLGYKAPVGSELVSSGVSLDADMVVSDTTLFEYLPDDLPLMSLGQLQHANLSKISTYPSYPLGNSLADYHFRDSVDPAAPNSGPFPVTHDFVGSLVRTDGVVLSSIQNYNAPSQLITAYYDISYLLNRALWDRYFVSTVPHVGTGKISDIPGSVPPILPNVRHVRQAGVQDADLLDANKAAAGLMVAGGFNINSTSEQAWRAVLGGINRLTYDPVSGSSGAALGAALPRFAKPTSTSVVASEKWQGYRQLSDVQIAQLARNIVAEVRNRGPFVSMSDFVNRRLRDNPDTTSVTLNADERFKGPIQNAIDAAGTLTDSNRLTGTTGINVGTTNLVSAVAPFTTQNSSYGANTKWGYSDQNLIRGGPANVAPYSTRSAFAPQFLTQGDVLSAIGAGLSARSDTFMIRTYGETVNPSDAGNITGRAWCEAVVQRVVEPVVRKNSNPSSADYNEPAGPSSGQADFGRRFKIVSFRWLTATDI